METLPRAYFIDKLTPPLLLITAIGLLLRLLALWWLIDMPGDGPTRAVMAYNWAETPRLFTHGTWLPGFTYLTGCFSLIVRDPLVSARIFNVVLGTLTIPVFYLLNKAVFGASTAIFCAAILSVFPLHVGLSATSLTEVSFLFFVSLGMLCLIKGFDDKRQGLAYLVVAFSALLLAEMIRYEAWILTPVFIGYVCCKTQRLWASALTAILLFAFPAGWMMGNHIYLNNALIGFTSAASGADIGAETVGIGVAGWILVREFFVYLGWVLPGLVLLGFVTCLRKGLLRRLTLEEMLYLTVSCLYWMMLLQGYFILKRRFRVSSPN